MLRLPRGPSFSALVPALLILLATLGMVRAAPIAPAALRVVDGDTVAVGKVHFRLVGFDTPEMRGRAGRCDESRALARAARDRLRTLIAAGDIALTEVACSCRPGTESTRDCNHGRRCGTLTAGGRDVGDILIAEGLARPYPYDWRHPPKPANWCRR
ncbi:thermonuclease family protein [Xanthobacter autotrophicus]|uniref:thermonuclease family protein n=1 Tax=Xanthobacter autotrophicus TaxID=280 RepID=UPI00372A0D85